MSRLQERIVEMIGAGASLREVERSVIDRARLPAEDKSALWLYARSTMDRDRYGELSARKLEEAELPVGD